MGADQLPIGLQDVSARVPLDDLQVVTDVGRLTKSSGQLQGEKLRLGVRAKRVASGMDVLENHFVWVSW